MVNSTYSAAEHIARSILLSRFHDAPLVAMFTAYFDAAGKWNRPGVLAVAGFVSDVRKWAKFESAWEAILSRESVSQFHMTDFVSSRGEFASWRGQTDRRRIFIDDLAQCAKRYTNKRFGGLVVLKDYEAANKQYRLREEVGGPYPVCAEYCVRLARKWQAKNDVRDLEFFFEQGDEGKGNLIKLLKERYSIEPSFLSKKIVPFQAADLVAWRTRDSFENMLKGDLDIERADKVMRSFREAWSGPHEAFHGDREWLLRYCREEGITRRAMMEA